ncbi:MAG: phosphatase PAP2 family protein [Planctomycetaceae bacterium]|nr:phosphatase PAP2 family protein [Planctomycetaceae bacterium]
MHSRCVLLLVLTAAALRLGGAAPTWAAAPDPILRWNLLALDATREDHSGTFGPASQGGPTRAARALAIVHLAMFDAANSVKKHYTPYRTSVPVIGQYASVDAAVAQAGHDTLVAMYPNQVAVFDAALTQDLNAVSNPLQRFSGVLIGKLVAKALLDARANDGSANNPIYTPGTLPGQHRVDPINPNQGFLTPGWGAVKPFALLSGQQFRAVPPPALTSTIYTFAYDQVKRLGSDGVISPTERTADQTIIGTFWGYDGTKHLGPPPRMYNQITRQIAQQKQNSVYQNARLFALLNLSMADAGIACWETKYHYNFWRPILGVRESDPGTGPSGLGDGNANTQGDVTWVPLCAPASNQSGTDFTPPFPAYPSGHATFGAALCQTLRNVYGTDKIALDFVSDEYNGITTDSQGNVRPLVTRHYNNLTELENENAMSRIYLGVHWLFDATSGVIMGRQVADFAAKHYLKPIGK